MLSDIIGNAPTNLQGLNPLTHGSRNLDCTRQPDAEWQGVDLSAQLYRLLPNSLILQPSHLEANKEFISLYTSCLSIDSAIQVPAASLDEQLILRQNI